MHVELHGTDKFRSLVEVKQKAVGSGNGPLASPVSCLIARSLLAFLPAMHWYSTVLRNPTPKINAAYIQTHLFYKQIVKTVLLLMELLRLCMITDNESRTVSRK